MKILGLQTVPQAGETLQVVTDEKAARDDGERAHAASARPRRCTSSTRVNLDTLFGEISAGKLKDLNIILKTDVQGSIEPIRTSLERLSQRRR